MDAKGLLNAAKALDELAAGRTPDPACLKSGIRALERIHADFPAWRDITDAAYGLQALAEGSTLGLDAKGRERAARLAEVVRSLADQV
jgi:hypothetical protein